MIEKRILELEDRKTELTQYKLQRKHKGKRVLTVSQRELWGPQCSSHWNSRKGKRNGIWRNEEGTLSEEMIEFENANLHMKK